MAAQLARRTLVKALRRAAKKNEIRKTVAAHDAVRAVTVDVAHRRRAIRREMSLETKATVSGLLNLPLVEMTYFVNVAPGYKKVHASSSVTHE